MKIVDFTTKLIDYAKRDLSPRATNFSTRAILRLSELPECAKILESKLTPLLQLATSSEGEIDLALLKKFVLTAMGGEKYNFLGIIIVEDEDVKRFFDTIES